MRWFSVLLLGCYADKGVTAFNSTPEITITSHPESAEISAGTTINLLASVSDLNDSTTDLSVEWLADLEPLCTESPPEASGDSLCQAEIPFGTEIISAIVRDPSGASGSDQISIAFRNQPPTARITSHNDGVLLQNGTAIDFIGEADDPENTPEELTGIWYANGSEICPQNELSTTGESVCSYTIQPESSSISFHVFDTEGQEASDTITLELIETEAPSVEIIAPNNSSTHSINSIITFSGLIQDSDTALSDLSISWESDIDGVFSQSTPSTAIVDTNIQLSEGTHTVRLFATDPDQNQGEASIIVQISPSNTVPTCSILEPNHNDVIEEGETVIFSALATDVETPAPQLSVIWDSSIDGSLGTSQASSSGSVLFPYSSLSAGTHLISLEVSDPEGLSCVEQILLVVGSAPDIIWNTPLAGDVVEENTSFSWNANISDAQDPPTDLSVSWESSLDGIFSNQGADSNGDIDFSSSLSIGTHLIILTVTDSDGMSHSIQRNVTTNGLPSPPVVIITPNPALSIDTLIAHASGSLDPEGTSVTYTYEWLQNGTPTTQTNISILASETTRGDIWTVIATPNDGTHNGSSTQTSVPIENSPPTSTSASITPSPSYNDSTLSCSAISSDADGDTLTETYSWSDGNNILGTNATLSLTGTLPPLSSITCTVTFSDGMDSGAQSTSAVLSNRDPISQTPSISPNTGIESGSVLTCAGSAIDPDNDSITMTYEWTHNSSPLATGTTIVLPTILSGDQISCIATATDPFGAYHTASQMVSIGNSAPEITSIILSPSSPNAQSGSISCLVSASDPDGDPITYTYEWSIDGVPQSNTSSILSGPFSHPSSITCTATASDALDSGTPQSATTSISNSLPSISGIILNPSPTYTSSTISAIYSIIDLDITQSTSATLAWHKIDGQSGIDSIVSTTGNILASSFFVKGDGIYLEVTPFDGYDLGTKVSSNLLTISNTPPTDPTVSVSPSLASAGIDDLICNVSGISTDIDGDPIDYTFVWRDANGSFAQSTTQTSLSDLYPGVLTNSGTWTCTVTANDGSDDSNPITASLSVSGACASHMDCPGGKFCAEWLTDGLLHCSDSCLDDTDCQSGSLCANLAGGSNVRYCTPFPTTTNGAGSFCTVDTDCDSGICFSGYCESHCGGETDCGVSESCHAVGNLSTGDLYSTCGMHTVYQDINQSCEINGVAGGDYCETGHCDIHQYDYYNGGSSSGFDPFCRPLCSKESDCDLSGQYPEVCDVVIVTDVPSSGVPISTLNPTPHSGITACYEPWSVGSLTTGTVCSQNTDCASNKCFNIMQGSPQRYCSAFCEDNSDCGGGTTCMTGSLSVANEWMLYHSSFSVTELQGITTLVKVCAF